MAASREEEEDEEEHEDDEEPEDDDKPCAKLVPGTAAATKPRAQDDLV